MSAQQASILLGLRPETLPSSAVGGGMDTTDPSGLEDETGEGEVTIGLGGGSRGRKGKKGKKEKRDGVTGAAEVGEEVGGDEGIPFGIVADPWVTSSEIGVQTR